MIMDYDYTKTLTSHFATIPVELRARHQWVIWKWHRGSKPPLHPKTGHIHDVHDPEIWSTFEDAVAAMARLGAAGIGFVLTTSDPYVAIDLDKCYDNGDLTPHAAAIIDSADSYTEISPSGNGVRIFVRAALVGGHRPSGVEVYGSGQYVTLTGNMLRDRPIRDAQDMVDQLMQPRVGVTSTLRSIDTISYSRLSLRPGGPLRRRDGTLRRIAHSDWLNQWLLGNEDAYYMEAARRGWDRSLSGVRFHGFATTVKREYPDDEIATIARGLFPDDQDRPDHWWDGEIWRCLYRPDGGARVLYPDIVPEPTYYRCHEFDNDYVNAPAAVPARRRTRHAPAGRPRVLTADELLRWYGEEAGKRLLDGPRARDAEALGVSVATLDRLDRELVARGALTIARLPGNRGRRVTLNSGWLSEVLSKCTRPAKTAAQRTRMPETTPPALPCIESTTGGGMGGTVLPPVCVRRARGRVVPGVSAPAVLPACRPAETSDLAAGCVDAGLPPSVAPEPAQRVWWRGTRLTCRVCAACRRLRYRPRCRGRPRQPLPRGPTNVARFPGSVGVDVVG